jgi:hypothetical protein
VNSKEITFPLETVLFMAGTLSILGVEMDRVASDSHCAQDGIGSHGFFPMTVFNAFYLTRDVGGLT